MKLIDLFRKTPVETPKKTNFSTLKQFNYMGDMGYNPFSLMHTSKGYLPEINPSELNFLYRESPLHSAIINFQKNLVAGNGYTIIGGDLLSMDQKIVLNQLTNQFESNLIQLAMDLSVHNRVCLEVTWNKDFTKVIKLERISPEKIHIDKVDEKMEPTHYLYNYDWNAYTRFPTKRYPKFDSMNKKDRVQMFMWQQMSPGDLLYATPSYTSALQWIRLDKNMGNYHESNITQSLNPSLLVQYASEPETKEEKQQILQDLIQSFAGARAAGRAMVTFSPDETLIPRITQMDANKLDKTFLSLTDTIQRQISYSHRLDPQLLGLKTPGSLGNSGDFLYSFNVYNGNVIQPLQYSIECIINKFLSINGLLVKFKLNEADVTKLLPSAMVNGGKVEMANDKVAEKSEDMKAPIAVNDNLKTLTGRQSQNLIRILKQYATGKITKDVACVLLKSGFGLSDEEITTMLTEETE